MAYEFVPLSQDTEEDSKPYSFVPLEIEAKREPAASPVKATRAPAPVAEVDTGNAMGDDFGAAIMAQNPDAFTEVNRGSVMTGRTFEKPAPLIEQRGAPVSEDRFNQLKKPTTQPPRMSVRLCLNLPASMAQFLKQLLINIKSSILQLKKRLRLKSLIHGVKRAEIV